MRNSRTLSVAATLVTAGALFAQAPNPVQTGVTPMPGGAEPIFRVDVTSRSIRAINYHSRQGSTKVDFKGTALMPEARGTADITPNSGAIRVSLKFDHLSNPAQYGPEYLTLVLWAITPEGRAERLGEIGLSKATDKTAELYATTDLQTFGMIVTAEPYFSVSQPSDVVVMENFQRNDTTGTMEVIDAKYELLKRGTYTLNIDKTRLSPLTSDIKVPLQLREARQAVAIAKAQGADRYAPDVMAKVAVGMTNAEGYYKSKQMKPLETVAREATQMAEDARRISIEKERENAEQAAKDASAAREAEARQRASMEAQRASMEAQRATEEAARRAKAEADTAAAQKLRQEAEQATVAARQAQQDAEAARQAALAEQAKLAQERTAALSAKDQAESARAQAENARLQSEKDAQALRERLRVQLNVILATRDSARGLIVSMSDVLFDFNQASLKPGTKEKLAKVSGILLAYPTLRLSVEGYTDSVGSDDYNQKLSERRAGAVRDYLTSNGIPDANVQAVGFGKANPVASNDNAAGRQQNRRVEMVVSGDVIGYPIGGPATNGGAATNQVTPR